MSNKKIWGVKCTTEERELIRKRVEIEKAHNGGDFIDVLFRAMDVLEIHGDLNVIQDYANAEHGGDLAKALKVLVEMVNQKPDCKNLRTYENANSEKQDSGAEKHD